jgi:hypothetical protein
LGSLYLQYKSLLNLKKNLKTVKKNSLSLVYEQQGYLGF